MSPKISVSGELPIMDAGALAAIEKWCADVEEYNTRSPVNIPGWAEMAYEYDAILPAQSVNAQLLSLVAAVRGERERASQLTDALERCDANLRRYLAGVPVRDMTETLAESERALRIAHESAGVVSSTQPEAEEGDEEETAFIESDPEFYNTIIERAGVAEPVSSRAAKEPE